MIAKKRFANTHHDEIYNMGHLLTAYCVELPVESGGAEAWQAGVFLPENVELTPRHDKNLLGGVTVLEGTALTLAGRDRFVREVAASARSPSR